MATSTAKTATVRYPTGVLTGDLLLLACQGRRDSMQWSAPEYSSLVDYDDQWPQGPPGLQFELLWRWATGAETATVQVTNATGVNGWSCVISAFRGGAGSGSPWTPNFQAGGTISPSGNTVMSDFHFGQPALIVHWFISRDDNNHGSNSRGTLGYGGPSYDTAMGTDHASSMVYEVVSAPESAPPRITMRQRSNAPDAWTSFHVEIELVP